MKKSYQLVLKLLAIFVVLLGFAPLSFASETDVKLEIADNKNNDLVIKVTNLNENQLKNITGNTSLPKEIKDEFSSQVIEWQIPSLKSSESQEIVIKRTAKKTRGTSGVNKNNSGSKGNGNGIKGWIPQLGEVETKQALQVIGLTLSILLAYLLIKKKKYSLLLLLLGLNLFAGPTALAIEKSIETKYQNKYGKELLISTDLSYDIVTNDGDTGGDSDEGTIRITGSALDASGNLILNQELVLTSADEKIVTSTDDKGYFYVSINRNKQYNAEIKDILSSSLVVNDLLDYTVTDSLGSIYLGKRIENQEVPDAYVKLGIKSVYVEPEKVALLNDGKLEITNIPDLEIGDIIVVGESDKYPNGIITKIAQMSVANHVSTITGSEVAVEEVFEEIHTPIEGPTFKEMTIDTDEAIVFSNDSPQIQARSAAVPYALEIEGSSDFQMVKDFKWDLLKDKNDTEGEEDENEEDEGNYVDGKASMVAKGEFGVKGNFKLNYAPLKNQLESEFSISPFTKVDFTSEFSLKTGKKIEEKFSKELGQLDFYSTVPFLSLSVPVKFNVSPSVEGKIVFNPSINIEPKYGFSLSDEGAQIINEEPKDIFKINNIDIEGRASIGAQYNAEPSIELGLNNKVIPLSTSLIEVSSSLGPEISTSAKKNSQKALEAKSSVDLKGEIKITPFKAIAEAMKRKGQSLEAAFSMTQNLWETDALNVSREDFSNDLDGKIMIQKGETIKLNVTDSNGNSISPKLIDFSFPKYATINKETLEMRVNDNVNDGDKFEVSFINHLFDIPGWFTHAKTVKFQVGNNETGTLKGIITEFLNDQPLEGAKLTFFDEEKNKVKEVVTTINGEYSVDLPKGKYSAEVNAEGYIPEKQHNITINQKETKFNAKLKLVGLDYADIGQVSGPIKNATNNQGVPKVSLAFRKGIDNKAEEPIAEIESNDSGDYLVNLPGGNYTMEMKKEGYVTGYANVVAVGKTESPNQAGSITPILGENEKVRIVLTWQKNPRDLDSHLTGLTDDKQSRFHIYYRNKSYEDSENSANLDVDDTTSYGPETVTVLNKLNEGTYTYAVHKYSGSSTLAASEAKVEVFMDHKLVNTFNVPIGEGDLWKVFEIRNGIIVPINQMTKASGHPPKTDELLPIN